MLLGVLCLSTALMAEEPPIVQETVRVTNGEWPPFLGENLKYYGLASRVVTEAFALKGIKVEYGFFPWKRAYMMAEAGEWDGSAVWTLTSEREKSFYWSNPVPSDVGVIFHLKTLKFDWKSAEDLKAFRMGVTAEYTYGKEIDEAIKAGKIQTDLVTSDEQNFQKLLLGRVDLFPVGKDVGLSMTRRLFTPQERQLITYHPKIYYESPLRLLLSRKVARNQRLMELFNEGLKQLQDSGKVDQYLLESRRGDYDQK